MNATRLRAALFATITAFLSAIALVPSAVGQDAADESSPDAPPATPQRVSAEGGDVASDATDSEDSASGSLGEDAGEEAGGAIEPAALSGKTPGASSEQRQKLQAFAKRNPLAFIEMCADYCDREYRKYTCLMVKQEKVGGQLLPEQEAEVRFIADPYCVDIDFTRNELEADRAVYVEGRWEDSDGQPAAMVWPAGKIVSIIVPKIKIGIHSDRALRESRIPINQFGFAATYDMVLDYSKAAKANGDLSLKYAGEGEIGGRPTWIIERHLPYNGPNSKYPDRRLIIHIDQENLMPIGNFSYADDAGNDLLGRYIFKNIKLAPHLKPSDFQAK